VFEETLLNKVELLFITSSRIAISWQTTCILNITHSQ